MGAERIHPNLCNFLAVVLLYYDALPCCSCTGPSGAVTECADLEQRKEVCFRSRQGLACEQLEQVPKVVAAVEGDPLNLHR